MKPAYLRPQAREDRKDEVRYYHSKAGTTIAKNFVVASRLALDRIEQTPGIGSLRLGLLAEIPDLRSWPVTCFPVAWLYFERADHLDVVRLIGERQDILAILEADH